MSESQRTQALEAVYECYIEGLCGHLDGMFVNFEDALFEIAYRGDDSARQARCFDLMRTLRQRRSVLEHTFLEELRCAWQSVLLSEAEPNSQAREAPCEDDRGLAMTISRKTHDHFTNLLEALRIKSEALAGQAFDRPDELPFSPFCAARSFVRASEVLRLDPGARHILYQMFERYVMDRLGPLLGQCNDALSALIASQAQGDACDTG